MCKAHVIDPEKFRDWLRSALKALDLSQADLRRALDLGQNTLGTFLATPGRDIRLSLASKITRHLTALAADRGQALPAMTDPAVHDE